MFTRMTLVLVLLVARTAWSQVEPAATGGHSDHALEPRLRHPINDDAAPGKRSGLILI